MAIASIHPLQNQVAGTVISPGDPDYEQARRTWNLTIDQYPALILMPNNVDDVMAGVRFAREAGLAIAVQSTGHGVQQPANGSLLIITSKINSVSVDVEARTAHVEAGALWGQVLEKSTPHGLAPLLGSSPYVGMIGYSLGGGIGWLARQYGLAADSVRSVDLVTNDGERVHASALENSDLFWGVRGGGGNFGVVTAIEFTLYPVAKIYGGEMIFPPELVADALRFFRDWVKTLPDSMTSSIVVMKLPTLPAVPEVMRGKVMVILRAVFTGDANEGKALMQPWLDWHAPTHNTFRELPFSEIGSVSNDPVNPAPTHYSHEMLDDLSDAAIDMIIHHTTDAQSPLMVSELRHAGGAISSVAPDSNAIGNRDAQFYLQIAAMTPTPEAVNTAKAYIQIYKDALRPHVRGGVYLNFLKGDDAINRVKDAYSPESYTRLLALKAKYDPENTFRFSYPLVMP